MMVCEATLVEEKKAYPLIVMTQCEGPPFSQPTQSEKASSQYVLSRARGPAPNSPNNSRAASGDPSILRPGTARHIPSLVDETGSKGTLGSGP